MLFKYGLMRKPHESKLRKKKRPKIITNESGLCVVDIGALLQIHVEGWLVVWVLWHINLCRLFNAKSIFMQIVCSISNNSV